MTLTWDPVLAGRVHLLDGLGPLGAPEDDDAAARVAAFHAGVPGYSAPDVAAEDLSIPGPRGPVDARVYRPKGGAPSGALMWVHGGGFIFGDLDMPEADVVSREMCERANLLVVSVDYRKCVDGAHYPVGQDDVYAAWVWLTTQFGEWSGAWAIGGGSAGASLSMATTQRAAVEGAAAPSAALLIYPGGHRVMPDAGAEFDDLMGRVPQRLTFGSQVMQRIHDAFIGPNPGDLTYAWPGDGVLNVFPRTLVVNCEFDTLRASGEKIAEDLYAAGVDVMCVLEQGVMHGHLNIPGLPTTLHTFETMVDFLNA